MLVSGYQKPAIIAETGWNHTFFEPGMPGYLAQYHNALWVSLAKGTAMTPFWWAYSNFLNDNLVTNQLRSISKFKDAIPFSKLSNIAPVDSTLSGDSIANARVIGSASETFAIQSDQMIFGWVVNADADVTADSVVIVLNAPKEGEAKMVATDNQKYKLKIFHTWRGWFVEEKEIRVENGLLRFSLPTLKIEDGQSRYLGQDPAFILEKM